MPAITYKDWNGGLDRRLPIGSQDANRLWELRNAYVTSGKKLKKRPCLKLVSSALTGSVGLESLNGGLCVFHQVGSGFVAPPGVGVFALNSYSPGGGVTSLVGVTFAKMILGFPYVVALHRTEIPYVYPPGQSGIPRVVLSDVPRHHYVDGAVSTRVTDVNCPHGSSVTIATQRVFSTGGEVVRYSAIGLPRNWTAASDAGFLPVSLQHDQREPCAAVGLFRDSLAVFFPEGIQLWSVFADPSANELSSRIEGVGTALPHSLASFYGDLTFASPFGLRSIAVQQSVDRVDETDIGVQIDSLVVPSMAAHAGGAPVYGMWLQQFGQYWVLFDNAGATTAYVYSYSKSSKLACWSVYTFPVLLTGITTSAGKVYVRTAGALYELDAATYTDAGTAVAVDIQMAYQDAKLPGVEKMFYGADLVCSRSAQLSYLYDPADPVKQTNTQSIVGDTRSGQLVPVEVTTSAIAPRFQHQADEAFELSAMTLYFHPLSSQSS